MFPNDLAPDRTAKICVGNKVTISVLLSFSLFSNSSRAHPEENNAAIYGAYCCIPDLLLLQSEIFTHGELSGLNFDVVTFLIKAASSRLSLLERIPILATITGHVVLFVTSEIINDTELDLPILVELFSNLLPSRLRLFPIRLLLPSFERGHSAPYLLSHNCVDFSVISDDNPSNSLPTR